MIARRALEATNLRQSLKELFSLLIAIFIWTFDTMIAAIILFPGLTPSSMLAGLGIGSVAIGFAFKDVSESFLAGIIILFRREMRIGDHIKCEGLEGEVSHIDVRTSRDEVVAAVKRALDDAGIEIPFPHSTLTFKEPLPISGSGAQMVPSEQS